MAAKKTKTQKKDRVGSGLYYAYICFMLLSGVLLARIFQIQYLWEPEEAIVSMLKLRSKDMRLDPERGTIKAEDGRVLAMSIPVYDIHMDCTVRKQEFAQVSAEEPEKGAALESEWMDKAAGLADGLARILGDKSSAEYLKLITEGRRDNRKYIKIATGVERAEFNRIAALPLFREGQNRGGFIVEKRNIRKYPYGSLARRTIGFVRDNTSNVSNTHVGVEGKYDFTLHGEDGKLSLRKIDNGEWVRNFDSTYVKPKDGKDIRTTIDIDIQDILDAALKEQVADALQIEGACAVVMEVETGAIRAMTNLWRDSTTNRMEETTNLVIGRAGEPGSVFKTSTLMTVLEDKKIKSLEDKIPTRHGHLANYPDDDHIRDYERTHHTDSISIIDGFKMSSNYVFRYLAVQNYSNKPKTFLDRIYMYKLGEAFDFDLGLAAPTVANPDGPGWSGTSLGAVAIGYSVTETPLHILTFYNAIANKGRLMKPYLIESIDEKGLSKEKIGPSVLNASICSRATADTITRALSAVTEDGTATRLKNAKCTVAGKTGTARVALPASPDNPSSYYDKFGRFKNMGTFVGFFPAESPKYSILVSVYSVLGHSSAYGGTLPAATVRTVVDKMYAINPCWGDTLAKSASVPAMKAVKMDQIKSGEVPSVEGMGLSDAIYAIESAGYRCAYSGVGHVVSQSPKAGITTAKGKTISIILK